MVGVFFLIITFYNTINLLSLLHLFFLFDKRCWIFLFVDR